MESRKDALLVMICFNKITNENVAITKRQI